jgi:hypothetical protein
MDPAGSDTLGDEACAHALRPQQRKPVIVGAAADGIGMPDYKYSVS